MKRIINTTAVHAMAAVWAFIVLSSANASAIPTRPEPPRLVNDLAGIFTPGQAQTLEYTLVEFDDTTSNQIAVITTRDLEGLDIADYAIRTGLEWQVGSEKFDNGIVIVVKPKEARSNGEVFIAVGYGLEGAIPDAYAQRIINNVMIPHFMNNDYYGGVREACKILMALASGEISELREYGDDEAASIIGLLIFLIFIAILIAAIYGNGKSGGGNNSRGPVIFTGPIITRGNDYGSFGSGFGGGFGGFGGFGGGSFGGGGAGGSW